LKERKCVRERVTETETGEKREISKQHLDASSREEIEGRGREREEEWVKDKYVYVKTAPNPQTYYTVIVVCVYAYVWRESVCIGARVCVGVRMRVCRCSA